MFKYNEPAITGNEVVLHNLPCELYRIVVNDKIPENCKYPLATIQDTRNQNQTNTGLAKLLQLKIGAKVMLTVNIDIKDRLINGQTGKVI